MPLGTRGGRAFPGPPPTAAPASVPHFPPAYSAGPNFPPPTPRHESTPSPNQLTIAESLSSPSPPIVPKVCSSSPQTGISDSPRSQVDPAAYMQTPAPPPPPDTQFAEAVAPNSKRNWRSNRSNFLQAYQAQAAATLAYQNNTGSSYNAYWNQPPPMSFAPPPPPPPPQSSAPATPALPVYATFPGLSSATCLVGSHS